MIQFHQDVCRNLEAAIQREWLETNGIGGFAASTIIGLNTRRYHGLLTAATQPPAGRMVLLSKLEEALLVGGQRLELSANQYPGVVHPQGFEFLKAFRLDPFPVFVYEVAGLEIEKTIFMIHGENGVVIQYEVRAASGNTIIPEGCVLELRPLIAFRDYHSTTHRNNSLDGHLTTAPGLVSVTPYSGVPTLYLTHDAAELDTNGFWYHNFQYIQEQERGLDFEEDLFSPFCLRIDLSVKNRAALIASTELRQASEADELKAAEILRRRQTLSLVPTEDAAARTLLAAADQFIVARGDQKSVIAGYHWFADWGRDTMISLPGLTLTTRRPEVAKGILLAFARHVDQGMLPNRFPDAGEKPEYNTVDATLWFFEAIRAYWLRTGDSKFIQDHLYAVLISIMDWHLKGTRYGIRVDSDGLLLSGEPGVQLTWMDAKIGQWVVTPRSGKAVEIQALWYNALRIMENLAREFKDRDREAVYREIADRARTNFLPLFWNAQAGCLFDVVDGTSRDAAMRPNQILAVSLPYSMLSRSESAQVVEAVRRELLTPYGLRSLSANDPAYRGRYQGGPWERDGAYHQGTVWSWLVGPFISAYLKVNASSAASRTQARQWMEPLLGHLSEAGLGQISEIFDGDAPHRPRGCVAQAWSVAELLRVLVEEVLAPEREDSREMTKGESGQSFEATTRASG